MLVANGRVSADIEFTRRIVPDIDEKKLSLCRPCLKQCLLSIRLDARREWINRVLAGEARYTTQPERIGEKVLRISKSVIEFGIPLGIPKYVSWLVELGPHASYDLISTISLVMKLLKSRWSDLNGMMAVGIYYLMAENRGKRLIGGIERMIAVNADIDTLLFYCLLAVNVGYESSVIDAQRLMAQQDYKLILGEIFYTKFFRKFGFPFFMGFDKSRSEIVIVFPGTRDLSDIVTDIDAVPITDGSGKFHSGIEKTAKAVFNEIGVLVIELCNRFKGTKVVVTGHSLGGAIGSLFSYYLKLKNLNVVCFAFGSPPCMDGQTAKFCEPFITSVVFRHDLVARASLRNIDNLVCWLNGEENMGKISAYISSDLTALKNADWIAKRTRSDEVVPRSELSTPTSRRQTIVRRLTDWFSKKLIKPKISNGVVSPHLVLAGKILHLHNSESYLSTASDFETIVVETSMVSDHRGDKYVSALLAAKHRRKFKSSSSSSSFPKSVPQTVCNCCGSDFLWNSILKGEPHVHLAKQFCRKCEQFVCRECSMRPKRSIPEKGVFEPVLHCDRCVMARSRL